MRLGEISKSESDDLFGSDNPLDRLRKFIRLKLPVYFEHSDDPPDAYRDQPIIMANEQNFVYTTKDSGMAYVPWTMPATLYHGGVKIDDWRFVQRNGDWILQQHFSEPKLSPVREESDDLFGPQRRTLTAREMSARMNLAAKQVGLDKILYRSGIADFGSGFEYHPIVSINQDGFQWANRNGTPIWATWEGAHEGGGRRWQYYRAPGTEGEYIFHLPIYDDDLDESQDDDLFEPRGKLKVVSYDIPREMVYVRSALGLLGVKILNWDVIDNHYFIVDDHEVRSVNNHDVAGQDNRNWYTAEFGIEVADKFEKHADNWLNEVLPDDVRQAMAEKYFLEEDDDQDDDLFAPPGRFKKIRQAILDTKKYFGGQLEYIEQTNAARQEVDTETVDALNEYIGQAEYVLQEFMKGGIAAFDNALKNVDRIVVDSIDADLYTQGISLNNIISQYRGLNEDDDLFSDVNPMSRLRKFHEQGREIKIADQNGNVWTAVKFLRGQQTGQPLMKIQREHMSGYNRHTESLNMTENGLEGADIQPGPGGKIFVYLKPFERTTIEEQDEDLFGEPTRRSKEIGEKLPVITQMMLALRQQNYQRALGLATAHKLEIPLQYLRPAMTTLLQNPHTVNIALSYLTQSVHQKIPELEPLLLAYIQDQLVNQPSAENYTANRAVEYLSSLAQARIPGLEEIFSSLRTARQRVSAKEALVRYGSNSAAADQWITRTLLPTWKSPEATAHYLSQVHKGQRIQALEPIVLKKADPALRYAAHNIKQRWPRAEAVIGSNGEAAYYYALYFLKPDRWIEAEPVIARDRVAWSMYARDFLGLNNHTKAGRAQRDAWRQQLLAGQPMTPPPQGPSASLVTRAQQQQNPNPINEQDDDLFEPQRLPRPEILKQLIKNHKVKLILTWQGLDYDVENVEVIPDEGHMYPALAGWYEFLVYGPGGGLTTIDLDPKDHELVRHDDGHWLIKEKDTLTEDQDDDLFEPTGVTVGKINRLVEQHGLVYIRTGTGDLAEIQEARDSEYPDHIELVLTTEWGETIIRNYPQQYLSIDYSMTPPRVIVGDNQLQESEDDLFGEPTKMAYVSRLLAALAEFQTEYTMALSAEENRDIRNAMHLYEKGDFIGGNAYLFDLYEENLALLKQYLYDRNLLAFQQRRLPGSLTLRENDDDLFEPRSPKKIAMSLSSAIDKVMDLIRREPIRTMDNGDRATRELQLLKYIQQGVDRGHFKGALELMLDLDDNVQEEIEYQLKRHSGLDINNLRSRYIDESDEDLFEPNQRLQIYRAIRSIADKFEELNTPGLESMQDLVTRYRRVADEFRKSMDQGYRSIWHILSGKYYWQRDLLFNNLKTPYGIDIEDQFLDWVEQGRQQQNR